MAPLVEARDVGEHVVKPNDASEYHKHENSRAHTPVRVGRRLLGVPETGVGELFVETAFGFGLVINGVKSNDALKEGVQLGV